MQTPDHLLDQQHSLKRVQYFRFLDDQEPPAKSSVKRTMTGSAHIGTSTVGQSQQRTLQCLPQTQMDWRTIPTVRSPAPFPTLTVVHRHQHQHQHQHYCNQSSDPGEAQRYGLKRSWNTMASALLCFWRCVCYSAPLRNPPSTGSSTFTTLVIGRNNCKILPIVLPSWRSLVIPLLPQSANVPFYHQQSRANF